MQIDVPGRHGSCLAPDGSARDGGSAERRPAAQEEKVSRYRLKNVVSGSVASRLRSLQR